MPNSKSAAKRMRSDSKRQAQNASTKSELRTLAKRLEGRIQAKKLEEAQKGLSFFSSKLDKAVKKGILHQNTASRKKSRFARLLAQSSTS